jgi:large subunit ribosomal protein L6
MSRIGKHAVALPQGVEAKIDGNTVSIKGKLGQLSRTLDSEISVTLTDGKISIAPHDKKSREGRAKWGLSRTLVNNMVLGVSKGYNEKLLINGVGFRAAMQGKTLVLSLGFSHEVKVPVPTGLTVAVEKQTEIAITGFDKQQVGQFAANIRALKPPEPYKGKGVKYESETIRRKEGKKK